MNGYEDKCMDEGMGDGAGGWGGRMYVWMYGCMDGWATG